MKTETEAVSLITGGKACVRVRTGVGVGRGCGILRRLDKVRWGLLAGVE